MFLILGRVVANGIGGGIKHKYHWVDWKRIGPKEGPPLTERVLQVLKCGCRTSDVALIGNGNKLRYILATENMKVGDVICTSGHIPRIPVRANEGDAYPLGALPLGTIVHNVERVPNTGGYYGHAAGTFLTIQRRVGKQVILQLPSKIEVALNQECMAVVGRVSNINHNKIPIGSAQRSRELGNRPRSGLWQRKSGIHGRKLRRPPPVRTITGPREKPKEYIQFSSV
ncbi:hypothetical protein B566_EDAN001298 [Ephemera danica]|nr:hypothetical protein B566_EDAN001298 [Ephemera danica]